MKLIRKSLILLCLLPITGFALSSFVNAQDIKGHGILTVPQVIKIYNKAQAGDAFSQADIGQALINGSIGVLPNYQRALYWFNKSAKQHEPLAYLNLAYMYLAGKGVPQSDSQAAKYAKLGIQGYETKIANKQYDKYQLTLVNYYMGTLYFWGVPTAVKQDMHKAYQLFSASANTGYAHAIKNVAVMSRFGIGTKKNIILAHELTMLLATAGNKHSQYVAALDFLNGQGVNQNTTEGIYWLKKAASRNYPPAIAALYNLYKQNKVKLNPAEKRTFINIMKSSSNNIVDTLGKVPLGKF